MGETAFQTATDCGGSVTVTRPSFAERRVEVVPYTGSRFWLWPYVAKVADFVAVAALFSATTYSVRLALSMRENAKMPSPLLAYRWICAPSARAGLAARTAESFLRCS